MGKTGHKLAIGAVVAGAAGFVAGILTAPKSGKETRKDIKDTANKAIAEGEKSLKKLHSELNELIAKSTTKAKSIGEKASVEIKEKINSANKAKQKVREILTALHDGDADSKELKAAIAEAKMARDHLKNFLQK